MCVEEEIRQIETRYAQAVDDHDVDALVALFADDAHLITRFGEHRGTAEIRNWIVDYYANQPRGRAEKHIFANHRITVEGETAEAHTDLLVFRCLDDAPWRPEVITRHHSQLEKRSGRWQFVHKRIELIGAFERVKA